VALDAQAATLVCIKARIPQMAINQTSFYATNIASILYEIVRTTKTGDFPSPQALIKAEALQGSPGRWLIQSSHQAMR
jgi:hypothetical protein